MMMLINRQLID